MKIYNKTHVKKITLKKINFENTYQYFMKHYYVDKSSKKRSKKLIVKFRKKPIVKFRKKPIVKFRKLPKYPKVDIRKNF